MIEHSSEGAQGAGQRKLGGPPARIASWRSKIPRGPFGLALGVGLTLSVGSGVAGCGPDGSSRESTLRLNGVPFEEGTVVYVAESSKLGDIALVTAQGRPPGGGIELDASQLTFDPRSMEEGWYVVKLMEHAAAGRLNLDGPIAEHLPFFNKGILAMLTTRQVIEHSAHLGGEPYEAWLSANSFVTPYKCQSFLANLGCDDTPGDRPAWRLSHVHTMKWLCEALGDEVPTHFSLKTFVDSLHGWREHAPESLALREMALLQGFHTATPASTDPPVESLQLAITAKPYGTTWKAAAVAGPQESSARRLDTSRQFVLSPPKDAGPR